MRWTILYTVADGVVETKGRVAGDVENAASEAGRFVFLPRCPAAAPGPKEPQIVRAAGPSVGGMVRPCGATRFQREASIPDLLLVYREHFQTNQDPARSLNNPKDRLMTTHVSDRPRTISAAHRCSGKESHADLSRDESQAMIQPVILNLSVRIHRRIALMEASSVGPAHGPDDFAALAWIQRSLEDVEATIIGLSEANRRGSSAFGGLAPSAGSLLPYVAPGQAGRREHDSY